MSYGSLHRWILATVVTVLLVSIVPMSGVAAGDTDVVIQPSDSTVERNGTETFDVVVESASGGVGSYDIRVQLGDDSVANLTSASGAGAPTYEDSPIRDGNASVVITATGADTADNGSVTIASVTVRGTDPGETPIDLAVTSISDEDGREYTIGSVSGGALTVEGTSSGGGGGGGGSDDDGGSTETTTADSDTADSANGTSTPSATPTPTSTPTTGATSTPTPTPTAEPTQTATATPTPVVEEGNPLASIGGRAVVVAAAVVLVGAAAAGLFLVGRGG